VFSYGMYIAHTVTMFTQIITDSQRKKDYTLIAKALKEYKVVPFLPAESADLVHELNLLLQELDPAHVIARNEGLDDYALSMAYREEAAHLVALFYLSIDFNDFSDSMEGWYIHWFGYPLYEPVEIILSCAEQTWNVFI